MQQRPASPIVIITEPGLTAAQPSIIRLVARPMTSTVRAVSTMVADGSTARLLNSSSIVNQLQHSLRPVSRLQASATGNHVFTMPSSKQSYQSSFAHTGLESSAVMNAVRSPSLLRQAGMTRPSGGLGSSMSSPNLLSLGGGSHVLYDSATGQIITNIRSPAAGSGRLDDLKQKKSFSSTAGLVQVSLDCAIH